MNSSDGAARTYDREELDLILRAAAEGEGAPASPALPLAVRDGMSLAEIQDIGAQVGINRDAVAAATLRVALDRAHVTEPRWQHVHTIDGMLDSAAWGRLADEIRAVSDTMDVRRSSDGLDFGIQKRDGELGQVRVSIRSADGSTTISIWSTAPHLGRGEFAVCGALGIPAAIFPVVGMAGGHWPVLSALAALAGVGFVAGSGATFAWQRWATKRWRARLIELLTPIATRATQLAAGGPSARDGTDA